MVKFNSMPAKLRGHHLICLNFFKGEGYSEEFIENINSVLKKQKVDIVKGPDDVCARCLYLINDRCSKNEDAENKIMIQDKEALGLMGLDSGMIVDRKTISDRVPGILEHWKEQFCLDCEYRDICFKN